MFYDEIKKDFPNYDADVAIVPPLIIAYMEVRIETLKPFVSEELYEKLQNEERPIKKYRSIKIQKQEVTDYIKTSEYATVKYSVVVLCKGFEKEKHKLELDCTYLINKKDSDINDIKCEYCGTPAKNNAPICDICGAPMKARLGITNWLITDIRWKS